MAPNLSNKFDKILTNYLKKTKQTYLLKLISITKETCNQFKPLGLMGTTRSGEGIKPSRTQLPESFLKSLNASMLSEKPDIVTFYNAGTQIVFVEDYKNSKIDVYQNEKFIKSLKPDNLGFFYFTSVAPGKYKIFVHLKNKISDFEIEIPPPQISSELAEVLEKKNIRMFFMPIVNLTTGEIMGYEALARKINEDRFPVEIFLEASSKSETFKDKLNIICLEKALAEMQKPMFPKDKKVFINLNPSTLLTAEIEKVVISNSWAISRENIVLEILEDNIPDFNLLISKMAHFKKFGFKFALDDQGKEGTYSTRLFKLSPLYLKADMEYVKYCLKESYFEHIGGYIKHIMKLNGDMIIEGIEENWGEIDIHRFCELGANYGQGYLFGKAKPIENIDIEISEDTRKVLPGINLQKKF